MEFREQRGTISFEEAERRYAELKRRHDGGQIDDEQFDTERQGLLVRDDEGRWWAKSRQTGQWLYHDGGSAWVRGTPPVHRRVGSEDPPERTERDWLEQPGQRPTVVIRPGSRSRLLIGLGALGAVMVVGLIAALAYSSQTGSGTANISKPTSEKKEEEKGEGKKDETKVESKPKDEARSKAATSSASDSKASASEEVETAVRGHYGAIGAGDFDKAYSYFSTTYRSTNTKEGWVANERTNQIRSSTINGVNVEAVSGSTATATIDVSFRDKTGTPRFLLTWDLVKEGEAWKLDSQQSGQKVN